jgi:hypothetical protein
MREARERQHDLPARLVGSGAAAVTRVASLRHDADARAIAEGEQLRDFLD